MTMPRSECFSSKAYSLPLGLICQKAHGRIQKPASFFYLPFSIDSKCESVRGCCLETDVGICHIFQLYSDVVWNHGSRNIELCVALCTVTIHVYQSLGRSSIHQNSTGAIFLAVLNLQGACDIGWVTKHLNLIKYTGEPTDLCKIWTFCAFHWNKGEIIIFDIRRHVSITSVTHKPHQQMTILGQCRAWWWQPIITCI